jgi:hypothetical protein
MKNMKMKTVIHLELEKMLRKELDKLKEYEEMIGSMTAEEKENLREWMAGGNSVGSNPYSLYDESGCLMDLVAASRIMDEMAAEAAVGTDGRGDRAAE